MPWTEFSSTLIQEAHLEVELVGSHLRKHIVYFIKVIGPWRQQVVGMEGLLAPCDVCIVSSHGDTGPFISGQTMVNGRLRSWPCLEWSFLFLLKAWYRSLLAGFTEDPLAWQRALQNNSDLRMSSKKFVPGGGRMWSPPTETSYKFPFFFFYFDSWKSIHAPIQSKRGSLSLSPTQQHILPCPGTYCLLEPVLYSLF